MPSKLRKALGAVKDQTSISLARVTRSAAAANLDVAVLRATTHDDLPVHDSAVDEVLRLAANSPAAAVRSLARRINRTRNWVVALKSLALVHRLLRHPDRVFADEAVADGGRRLLNLSAFRDDSTSSSPWDYTAFVRTFALYLDQRLDCFLAGKIHGRGGSGQLSHRLNRPSSHSCRRRRSLDDLDDVKPTVLLDKIAHWQKLLDRFIATRPTGPAKNNRLVQASLSPLVRESFDLYRDVSDGVALLLDNFFHIPLQASLDAFHVCGKASKQFDELAAYYALCKSLGMGRTSEYPSVQPIADNLLDTLNDLLKDSNHPGHSRASSLLRGGRNNAAGGDGVAGGLQPSSPSYNSARESSERELQTDDGTELDFKSALGSIGDDDDDRLMERWWISETASERRQGSAADSAAALNESESEAGWERILMETANDMTSGGELQRPCGDPSAPSLQQYNPFLQIEEGGEFFSPTWTCSPMPPPTFCARNPGQTSIPPEADPFSPSYCIPAHHGDDPTFKFPPFRPSSFGSVHVQQQGKGLR